MKRIMLSVVLITLTASTTVFSQVPGQRQDRPPNDMRIENQSPQRQFDLEERKAELEFNRKVRELELRERELELNKRARGGNAAPLVMIIFFVVNILLAVWVYQDIRQRKAGSGVWIVITLLVGFFGALLYALVRLGDIRQEAEKKE